MIRDKGKKSSEIDACMDQRYSIRCWDGHQVPAGKLDSLESFHKCPECDKSLFIQSHFEDSNRDFFGGHHEFWDWLRLMVPATIINNQITLREGNTKLVASIQMQEPSTGKVWFKDESQNPTRSYRDRAAAVLVAHARSLQCRQIFSAGDGNMAAAISAYAARAGLSARIFSDKKIDIGKKAQILTYGGILDDSYSDINDAIDDCLNKQFEEGGYQATAELNPLSMLAQKTIAYEIITEGGIIPDEVYVPCGNGGTLFSLWQGFCDMQVMGIIDKMPRMQGATISSEDTRISPLKESKFSQRDLMEVAINESGGNKIEISDDEISNAISTLAQNEGLFVEPATAAAYAALLKINAGEDVIRVVILTGTGLKAPSVIEALLNKDRATPDSLFVQNKMNLRLKILDQLKQAGDAGLHGYKIFSYVNKEVSCSRQAIYHHLKQMEDKGFITNIGTGEQGKKIYRLTAKGMDVLDLLSKLVELF
ncbi:MAG TPA: pyridoxal-phosphate dependent enzyme [Candidatus Lokiarchaeia archaeon]|nr:pyridoxal-phosphate dependent enzyme [Candidatus Lokiarchaeia archaeon]